MNCFDCLTLDHIARPAIGVCHDCGTGACDHHAVVRAHALVRVELIQRIEPVDPPARALRCTTCDAAHTAAARPSPRRHARQSKLAGAPAISL